MKLTGTTCYSHILWLLCSGAPLSNAIKSIKFDKPAFDQEGVAGFIEVKYEIEILDIRAFANIWDTWYTLSDTRRLHLYGLAKGLGDAK